MWKRIPAAATVTPEPEPPPDPVCHPDPALIETLQSKIAALERELERREQSALRAGFEKGRAAGEQEAAARLTEVIDRFAATVADLAGRRGQLRRDAEADVVKLAIAIARRVLHRELNADPEALLGLVKAALAQLENRELARVRVHPEDAGAIRAQVERLRPSGKVEIVPDAGLARGAAVFETSRGALDASVETQLAEIERGLIDRLLLQP
jgi:flagellar assembly protein FliH